MPKWLRQLPALITLPVILFMLYILFVDKGSAGWWGFTYNRLYLLLGWLFLFTSFLLLTRRPWACAGLTSTIIGGLWVGAYIKYQYLSAQLIAPDLTVALLSAETLLEMGLLPTLALLGYLLLNSLCFLLEKPPTTRRTTIALWFLVVTGVFITLNIPPLYVDLQWTAQSKQTLPIFVQSIWRAQLTEPQQPHKTSYCCFQANQQAEQFTETPQQKPNIVVILEESTFHPDQLLGFKSKGKFFPDAYPLKVHTAGGATWVQEIAFLHGVAPPLYGDGWRAVNLFTPGHLDGRIAPQLVKQGYATKTIYPIAGRFYGGRQFHEQLGIQDFIDCKAMPECAKRKWNKMPDEIFFDETVRQLQLSKKPVFAFVATMRQHSPHDKDRQYDARQCKPSLSAKQCSIMLDYDERMKASISAYLELLTDLQKLPERTIVVAFGDHIPGDVAFHFQAKDFVEQDRFRTFFNVWDSANGFVTHDVLDGKEYASIDVAMLDALIMRYAGFDSQYLHDKLVHMQECSGSFCDFGEKLPRSSASLTRPQSPAP